MAQINFRQFRVILVLVVLASILASCTSSAKSRFWGKTQPPQENVFRYVSGPEPESLDPQIPSGQPEARVAMALFEGLVEYDPKDQQPIPAIAERWEASPKVDEFLFFLRKNAKWSDGKPITARDFVYSFRRGFRPETLSRTAALGYFIKYSEAYNGKQFFVRKNGNFVTLNDIAVKPSEIKPAEPFGAVNSSKGVALKTGRLIENPDKQTGTGKVVRDICPTASGAKDWQPSAFSPRTGLLYIPHNNLCMDEQGVEVNYIAGTPYVGMNVRMIPGPGGHRGEFTAWDIAGAKPVWKLPEKFPVWSGAVVTAGDVVFYGTMDGWFKALDAHSGAVLWQFKTSSGIISQPISYRGPDGRQYVAVLAGVGGWAGAIVSGDLDPRDATAALGFVNAMKDLKQATNAGGELYVFRLP